MGDAEAQYEVGNIFSRCEGIKKDYRKALVWYKKAAVQNHPEAQNRLADAYRFGYGIKADIKPLLYWYEQAANNGVISALLDLGEHYYYLFLDSKMNNMSDCKKAFDWYLKAATSAIKTEMEMYQVGEAQYWVGYFHEQGRCGFQIDLKKAIYWYKRSEKICACNAIFALSSINWKITDPKLRKEYGLE